MHIQHYFSASLSTYTEGAIEEREGPKRESNKHMNNVEAGKRPSWNTAHFVADTIPSHVTLDGSRTVWSSRHKDTHSYRETNTHLSAGLLMLAGQIVETSCDCVDLSLQREAQSLVILLGDQTLLCSLLGLEFSQLHLLLTQSLLSCCCTALTGLQGVLELCLRGAAHRAYLSDSNMQFSHT